MKKISIAFIIIVFLGAVYYFNSSKQHSTEKSVEVEKKVFVKEASQTPQISGAPMDVDMVGANKNPELDALDKKFEEQEQLWLSKVEGLLVKELDIGDEKFREYLKMREGLANDKIRAFEKFHKELEAKYGENYTYNPTEEELMFEKEIGQKYDDLLKNHIGKENFRAYLELRDEFNQKLIEEQNPDQGVILMDL